MLSGREKRENILDELFLYHMGLGLKWVYFTMQGSGSNLEMNSQFEIPSVSKGCRK